MSENNLTVIDVNEVIKNAQQSHLGVIMDNKKADDNLLDGKEICKKCGGTGNEFFMMYKKCSDCDGKGHSENENNGILLEKETI